jgi:hypothetical protein
LSEIAHALAISKTTVRRALTADRAPDPETADRHLAAQPPSSGSAAGPQAA